jgi:branched-chain amino acid transport system permease protein
LGHAAFIGLGAFTAGYLGGDPLLGGHNWPLLGYLLVATVLGGLVGFVVGLPALRLRGNYLVIVTVGLVFIALYLWKKWTTVTGGNAGRDMPFKAELYHFGSHSLNFLGGMTVFGKLVGPNQGLCYLAWGLVAVAALVVKNIVRSRPGRALQAVRDRDLAAEVVGVSLFRYKVGAFVISSAIASLAGALYGLYVGHVTPNEQSLGLALSIQFLAIIVVGGIGTIYGSVLGAILVGALPALIDRFAGSLPLVTEDPTKTGISKGALGTVIYAVLIIVFLVLEPRGLAGIWRRLQTYFGSWPFSY